MCSSSTYYLFKFMERLKCSSFYCFAFGLGQILHVSLRNSLLMISYRSLLAAVSNSAAITEQLKVLHFHQNQDHGLIILVQAKFDLNRKHIWHSVWKPKAAIKGLSVNAKTRKIYTDFFGFAFLRGLGMVTRGSLTKAQ